MQEDLMVTGGRERKIKKVRKNGNKKHESTYIIV
jgi:hypothetical protein